jgi:hypothetical protein
VIVPGIDGILCDAKTVDTCQTRVVLSVADHHDRREFGSSVFPYYAGVLGFVSSIVTIVLGFQQNIPWLTAVGVLTNLLACLFFCHHEFATAELHRRAEADERARREQCELNLRTASLDVLAVLEQIVDRDSYAQWTADCIAALEHVGRLLRLLNSQKFPLSVSKFQLSQPDQLMVAAKLSAVAATHIREGDPFFLFDNRSDVRVPLARLQLHQPVSSTGGAFFRIVEIVNQPMVDGLRNVSDAAELKVRASDYVIEPAIDCQPFSGLNIDSAIKAVSLIGQTANEHDGMRARTTRDSAQH